MESRAIPRIVIGFSARTVLAVFLSATACRESGSSSPSPPPSATPADAQSTAELSPDERARLIERIGHELEAHYVDPPMAAKMAAALRERAKTGGYDGVVTNLQLARVITEQLRAMSHDRHAMLEWTPATSAMSPEDQEWERRQAVNRASAGFGATERLPGNVAHLTIRSFEPGVKDAVTRHLSEVADANALIIDLRDNTGGDLHTVAYVASYVVDGAVHLNDMWWRDDGSTEAFFTLETVPGQRFGSRKPVLVLTSKHTFSAAEELAYDLQALHRATIVGEATAGGAHPVSPRQLSPSLTLRVPTGRAVNPVTKTDWEGTGVLPDIQVEANAALGKAHVEALHAILAESSLSSAERRSVQAALTSRTEN